jgi:hypothetical protein
MASTCAKARMIWHFPIIPPIREKVALSLVKVYPIGTAKTPILFGGVAGQGVYPPQAARRDVDARWDG